MLLYRIISIALFPFLELYLFYRIIKKKEDKKRLKERFGTPTQDRPEGEVIWMHAVSVGEVNSALILIDELLKSSSKDSILLTTTTLTSAAIIAKKIPDFNNRVIHQFLPIDSYYCVKKFFDFWQPKKAIFVESEIWPNLLFVANQYEVPIFLVNARMSAKSSENWLWAKRFGLKPFDYFAAIFAQSDESKERLENLTENKIFFYGNLKSQANDLNFNSDELEKLKSQIGNRKLWLAASTHAGEEESVIAAHQELKKDFPDILTILIPRHPNRGDEIKSLIGDVNSSQRSKGEIIENTTEIYLADSLNELGIFYRLIDFAFIGGSLVEVGGHNPFEPIKLGCAVISGAYVFNFREVYENLSEQDACVIINSADQLSGVVKEFLQNGDLAPNLLTKASLVIENSSNIVQKIVAEIDATVGPV